MSETTITINIEDGALLSAPVYESHSRGKNWLATIFKQPTAPGGIGRNFHRKANGEYYYMATDLKLYDPIEFGGDYYTGAGNPKRNRFYGVIIELTEEKLVIEKCETARQAVKLAKAYIKNSADDAGEIEPEEIDEIPAPVNLHVHFMPTPEKQFCELKQPLEVGQTLTVHVHDTPHECEICPNGHCHAPNVNLTRVDESTIFLSFENFLPPMVCEIKDLPPHHIEHADEILSESELTN